MQAPLPLSHQPSTSASRPSLLADSRGGMMLLGVFAAVFLCGAVFLVAGIGQAIAHRERMQDAADAAALASAVVHAKGMNVLVLINLVMAALLAILVALKLVETLAIVGIMLATAIAWMLPPAGAAIGPLTEVMSMSRQAYSKLDDPVHQGLRALNATSQALRLAVPALSQARVLDAVQQFDPPAIAGIAVPGQWTLPTQDGDFATLCGKAGEFAGTLAMLPLAPLGVEDLLSGPLSDLTSGNAQWFCGADGGTAPSTTVTVDSTLPELPLRTRCRVAGERLADGRDEDPAPAQALCADALDEEMRSQPHPETGRCETDCGAEGAYATRAVLARAACVPPTRRGQVKLEGFVWQEQRVRRTYRRQGRRMVIASREVIDGPFLKRGDRPPCGEGGLHDDGWRLDAGDPGEARDDVNAALADDAAWPTPLCDTFTGHAARSSSQEGVEVIHVFACTSNHRVTRGPSGSGEGAQRDSDEVPQKLKAGAQMGDGHFQLRAAVFGARPGGSIDHILGAASWGGEQSAVLPDAGRFAIAQAEYYFDGDGGGGAAMWQMRWRARLRRFRVDGDSLQSTEPDGIAGGSPDVMGRACRGFGHAVAPALCDALEDNLDLGATLVAH